jgi:hypothetical protein
MAQIVLTSIGTAIGGPLGGAIGSMIGASLDQAMIRSLSPARQVGPRLSQVRITSVSEGAPMAAAYGRARVGGQVIWAAQFKEHKVTGKSGKGKGAQKTTSYTYSLSFAVALCEGQIGGIGRVWADGKALDMTGMTMRLYRGGQDQMPDPLIEAIEGVAPAYRGLAYVVFEDLALDAFGNRPPQLSFEVYHRPQGLGSGAALEDRLGGVCLIPGAGEFVYSTETVLRRQSLIKQVSETVNNAQGRPDFLVSLDQLQAQLPNIKSVMLVVSWFGTDLRVGQCKIRPGIEGYNRITQPLVWRAGGVGREDAYLISVDGGGPAYGGTPSDQTVRQAITELKARGFKVGLYPFILMDVPQNSTLPDPYGAARQPSYPWRGRITCDPAPGRPGSPDKTLVATAQVQAFFGQAQPGHFGIANGEVTYSGPSEWGLRRMILHYARLVTQVGGVDTFLIGSELRAITQIRGAGNSYPAVQALQTLAQDCRSIIGTDPALSYSADWTEYNGHQPNDGTGEVRFHLDPLWADPAVSFVGIDWYAPLADWRDGEDHLDAKAGFTGPSDPAYLAANVFSGEGADWYYASDADRMAQTRKPISDGAYGEPWVYAPKALKAWWGNLHYDRPGGVRATNPTGWIPQSKPVRLIEFGCPAVDKGANSPNLFIDAKSSESFLPPFSNGARDDLGQRRALEAMLVAFAMPTNNPLSSVYGGPMVADDALHVWCWDARPYPDFPARSHIWSDAPNWARGHWLNGRAGGMTLADLTLALAARGGAPLKLEGLGGVIGGYVIERPMRLRDALEPLGLAFGFDAAERNGQACLVARDAQAAVALPADQLALIEDKIGLGQVSRDLTVPVDQVRIRFVDERADYQIGAVSVRREPGQWGGSQDIDLPIITTEPIALAAARRTLATLEAERDRLSVPVGPLLALRAEPGDLISLASHDGVWRVERVRHEAPSSLDLVLAASVSAEGIDPDPAWRLTPPIEPSSPPILYLLDLPPLNGQETDVRPIAAAAAQPWRSLDLWAGSSVESLTQRASLPSAASLGQTLTPLMRGPLHRLDRAAQLEVQIEGEALMSRSLVEVLAGANSLAIQSATGAWEIIQFLSASVIGENAYRLKGLLRGQGGSDPAMADLTPAGAAVVVLSSDLARVSLSRSERGLPLIWRAAPAGGAAAGLAMTELGFAWQALAERPWAPAHLRVSLLGNGDRKLSWIRRTRLGGDDWGANEVPLSEDQEGWKLEVLLGETVVRTVQTSSAQWLYTALDQATDFAPAQIANVSVRIAQASASFGWGAAQRKSLL